MPTAPISRPINWRVTEKSKTDSETAQPDNEFEAIRTVFTALEALVPDARTRVLNYINSRLNIATESELEGANTDTPIDATRLTLARQPLAKLSEKVFAQGK